MKILFLSHYFPPEVNAPASRTYENARQWVEAGHRVTVITCAPNHPRGKLYPGYANKWVQWEMMAGIRVLRVRTFLAANRGVGRRSAGYVSYMLAAILFCALAGQADVVVSTSPQFFCGLAGWFVARLKHAPFVLEIRDLWPESIKAVGALRAGVLMRGLEALETLLYRRADHIIALTRAFARHIRNRGVAPGRITVITNGANLRHFAPQPKDNAFSRRMGLTGKFVAAYVGTLGMAHGLETMLTAARQLKSRPDMVFLLVGDGARRAAIAQQKAAQGLSNVVLLDQQPKERIPAILAAADACLVLLKNQPLFRTVIPSKIFEAMAMGRPLVLGVEGESREIVAQGECGLCIPPENSDALARALCRLRDEPHLARTLGENGRYLAVNRFDRDRLAHVYLDCLARRVTGGRRRAWVSGAIRVTRVLGIGS